MRNSRGFTLMEVMTAIAIVAIISGPLLQMFITSSRVGRSSYNMDKANTVAVGIVEEIRADPSLVDLYEDGTYAETTYYTSSWQPADSSDYAFRAELFAQGVSAGTSIGMSFIPELIDSGGNNYQIGIDCGRLVSGTYLLTCSDAGEDDYSLDFEVPVALFKRLNGVTSIMMDDIPAEDCVSSIIPIVVDVEDDPKNLVFQVENDSPFEVALYVYGDYNSANPSSHYVTAQPLSGTISINYMKVDNDTLDFDELEVNVKVVRYTDDKAIADYTTKVYLVS